MSNENAQNVLTLELAADRWVQKDDHWYWFMKDTWTGYVSGGDAVLAEPEDYITLR